MNLIPNFRKNQLWFFFPVCMYVFEFISQAQEYITDAIFMKNISLKYHSHILPISARFFLLQESSSIWHLDVHPNLLFWAFCSEGNVLIRFCLFFAKESHMGSLILCPAHRSLFFGVNWWGIVSWSNLCTLLISGNQANYGILVLYVFFREGLHIYISFHICIRN